MDLGDAVRRRALLGGVALVDRLEERQEVAVAGLFFALGGVRLVVLGLEGLPITRHTHKKKKTHTQKMKPK
jgi:hypothetical protein